MRIFILLILLSAGAAHASDEDCQERDGVTLCATASVEPGGAIAVRIAAPDREDVHATVPAAELAWDCEPLDALSVDVWSDRAIDVGLAEPAWIVEVNAGGDRWNEVKACGCEAEASSVLLYDPAGHRVFAVLPWRRAVSRCDGSTEHHEHLLARLPTEGPDRLIAVGAEEVRRYTPGEGGVYVMSDAVATCEEGARWGQTEVEGRLSTVFGCVDASGAVVGLTLRRPEVDRGRSAFTELDAASAETLSRDPLSSLSAADATRPSEDVLAVRLEAVRGSMDRRVVERMLSRRSDGLRGCLTKGGAPGVLRFELVVMTKGTVVHSRVLSRSMEDAALEACALRELEALILPNGRIDGAILLEVEVERARSLHP